MWDVPPSYFCRDRASEFVWAPYAKTMHQLNWLQKLNFFSTFEGAHPPQTPPVPIPLRHPCTHPKGAEVLLVLNLGAPAYKKSWIRPCHSSVSGFQERNFRGAKLTEGRGNILQLCYRAPKLMTHCHPPPPPDGLPPRYTPGIIQAGLSVKYHSGKYRVGNPGKYRPGNSRS